MQESLTARSAEQIEHLSDRVDGQPPSATGGSQAPHTWERDHRSAAERDRDRILYSSAFARLAYVTQVTAPESGHTFHNRLSHSLKAADIKAWPAYEIKELLDTIAAVAGRYAPSGAYRHTRDHRREMRSFGSELITRYMGAFRSRSSWRTRRVDDDPGARKISVTVPAEIEREVEALKMLVRVYVIRRPGLAIVQHGQQRIIEELFEAYFEASEAGKEGDRRIFPPGAKRTLEEGPNDAAHRARVVVDLIAGLTEESAFQLHRRLFGEGAATALDRMADMA